jgi:hypothetical protein
MIRVGRSTDMEAPAFSFPVKTWPLRQPTSGIFALVEKRADGTGWQA